jgi:hypothetical protein
MATVCLPDMPVTQGGYVMKIGYGSIGLIFLILASLLVSGCTGGNGGNTSPTPTVGPGLSGGDSTPAPAAPTIPAGDTNLQKTLSQLVNPEGLHDYRYRVTQTTYGINQTFYVDVAYSDGTFKGIPAKHIVITAGHSAANGTPDARHTSGCVHEQGKW